MRRKTHTQKYIVTVVLDNTNAYTSKHYLEIAAKAIIDGKHAILNSFYQTTHILINVLNTGTATLKYYLN